MVKERERVEKLLRCNLQKRANQKRVQTEINRVYTAAAVAKADREGGKRN